jgi:hypothetical protein
MAIRSSERRRAEERNSHGGAGERLYKALAGASTLSGGCRDYCVELFPLLKCCQKRECFAVSCYRSGQIVECRGVFSRHTSGYLGIR